MWPNQQFVLIPCNKVILGNEGDLVLCTNAEVSRVLGAAPLFGEPMPLEPGTQTRKAAASCNRYTIDFSYRLMPTPRDEPAA